MHNYVGYENMKKVTTLKTKALMEGHYINMDLKQSGCEVV
jgi:hypothetical protein